MYIWTGSFPECMCGCVCVRLGLTLIIQKLPSRHIPLSCVFPFMWMVDYNWNLWMCGPPNVVCVRFWKSSSCFRAWCGGTSADCPPELCPEKRTDWKDWTGSFYGATSLSLLFRFRWKVIYRWVYVQLVILIYRYFTFSSKLAPFLNSIL